MTGADEPAPAGGEDRVARATRLLREHTDPGWEAVQDRVVARALTLFRGSAPVLGRHGLGEFSVASDVLVGGLRAAVDAVPGAAAQRIACTTDGGDRLQEVTVELVAARGRPLHPLADRVHAVALAHLRSVLGDLAPTAAGLRTHVHVGDVSEDPRVVD